MQINITKRKVGKIFNSLPEGILLSIYLKQTHVSLNIIKIQILVVQTGLLSWVWTLTNNYWR
jgi:hypothetical protein